jgi:hypothetical protein
MLGCADIFSDWGHDESGAGRAGSVVDIFRFSSCLDARNPVDRTAAGQGGAGYGLAVDGVADDHAPDLSEQHGADLARAFRNLALLRHCLSPDYLRSHGALAAQAAHRPQSRRAGAAPLSERVDRDQPADHRAGYSDQCDGAGAGAGIRSATGVFHLHHPVDAAAGFLAVGLYRPGRRRRIVRDGDVVPSGAVCRRGAASTRISSDPQRRYPGLRRARRLGRTAIASR